MVISIFDRRIFLDKFIITDFLKVKYFTTRYTKVIYIFIMYKSELLLSLHNVYEKLPHTGHVLQQYFLVFDYILDMNVI